MDTTLVTVTLLSMAMAAALSVIVWRMVRGERQRTDARVAALAGLAARTPAVRPVHESIDLPIRSSAPAAIGGMFEEAPQSSPWGQRFAVMAGLGLVLASVILFALAANGTKASAKAASAPAAAAAASPGLELLSLRDSRKDGALTITGLVRNPQAGAPLSRVAVTAYTFDESGAFLASGRALIDVTSLAPGDESPFVVSVPVSDTVARYRIGFRSEDGRVIAHVDRRQQGPIAANW
jgi:hypothetical protein